jgi:hypothetical protein
MRFNGSDLNRRDNILARKNFEAEGKRAIQVCIPPKADMGLGTSKAQAELIIEEEPHQRWVEHY